MVLHLLRNPVHFSLQVGGISIKQVEKYVSWVAFMSDGRQDKELYVQSGKASAVIRTLHHSVVLKQEISRKTKLAVFVDIRPHPHL